MKRPRRKFLRLAAGAAALPTISRIGWTQAYPSRPVRLLTGFAAAGGSDVVARLIGQWLSERLGQSFIIENRPGAGGNIGTESVVRAPPDGYTLLLVTFANVVNASLYKKLNFNFIRDIAPVAGLIRVPDLMAIHPSVPVRSVPEFIEYAKANAGKITMASAGNGSSGHLAGELLKMMVGINLGPRTVSRQWACADRPARRPSGADVSHLSLIGRICKVRRANTFMTVLGMLIASLKAISPATCQFNSRLNSS